MAVIRSVRRAPGRCAVAPSSRPSRAHRGLPCLRPPSVVPPRLLQGRSVPPSLALGPVLTSLRDGLRPAFPVPGAPALKGRGPAGHLGLPEHGRTCPCRCPPGAPTPPTSSRCRYGQPTRSRLTRRRRQQPTSQPPVPRSHRPRQLTTCRRWPPTTGRPRHLQRLSSSPASRQLGPPLPRSRSWLRSRGRWPPRLVRAGAGSGWDWAVAPPPASVAIPGTATAAAPVAPWPWPGLGCAPWRCWRTWTLTTPSAPSTAPRWPGGPVGGRWRRRSTPTSRRPAGGSLGSASASCCPPRRARPPSRRPRPASTPARWSPAPSGGSSKGSGSTAGRSWSRAAVSACSSPPPRPVCRSGGPGWSATRPRRGSPPCCIPALGSSPRRWNGCRCRHVCSTRRSATYRSPTSPPMTRPAPS